MTENLPVQAGRADVAGPIQPALFGDADALLALSIPERSAMVADLEHSLDGFIPQLQRGVGRAAWLQWHSLTEKPYAEWERTMALRVGRSAKTVRNWRDAAVELESLPVPAVAQLRSEAASAGKTAGQVPGAPKISTLDTTASAVVDEPEDEPNDPAPEPTSYRDRVVAEEPAAYLPMDQQLVIPAALKGEDVARLVVVVGNQTADVLVHSVPAEALRRTADQCLAALRMLAPKPLPPTVHRTPTESYVKPKRVQEITPKDCKHPTSRRLGKACGACGKDPV